MKHIPPRQPRFHVERAAIQRASGAPNPARTGRAWGARGALNRLTRETDNDGGTDVTSTRTTEYFYDDELGVVSTTDILYPDGSEELVSRNTDGSLASDQGTAVTSSVGNEGVITTDGIDAHGGGDTLVKAGSTWTSVTTDGAQNTTTTYRNTLGQAYLVQKTRPGSGSFSVQPVADAYTSFDPNGRPLKYVDFDGTTTYSSYDPVTGQLASQFVNVNGNVDANGNGIYDPGIDRKTITKYVTQPSAASATPSTQTTIDNGPTHFIGSWSSSLINSGSDTTYQVLNLSPSGRDSVTDMNGQKTETTTPPAANGSWVRTTTYPDKTKSVYTYADGLLVEEQTQTATGSDIITPTTYVYDGLRRLTDKTDYHGTTHYEYFEDGTQKSVAEPGHPAAQVSSVDKASGTPTQSQRPDSGTVNTPQNLQGQTSAQYGAGIVPTTLGYDTTNTGQLTSITTYRGSATFTNNSISGTGTSTTTLGYDQATGFLTSQKFADGSNDQYQFNGKFQLANVIMPGLIGSSFAYNGAGEPTLATLTDAVTGKVSTAVTGIDEAGRPLAVSETDNGRISTIVNAFDDHQRVKQTLFGSVDNVGLYYDYAPDNTSTASEVPGGLRTMTLKAGDGVTALSGVGYSYSSNTDSSTRRLQSISLPGGAFSANYVYFTGGNTASDQINSVQIKPVSGNPVTITYSRDPSDLSRLDKVTYSGSHGAVFTDSLVDSTGNGNFNPVDQITGRRMTRTKPAVVNGTVVSQGEDDKYTYHYDPNKADSLDGVYDTDTNALLYSYGYDNAGNRTNEGTVNSVNEYGNFTFNTRHDLTSDGTFAYGYDAKDRLISITPATPTSGSVREKMGYDSDNRMVWLDVYAYGGGNWNYSVADSQRFMWDGDRMAATLDPAGHLLQTYTYGPTGLVAVSDYTQSQGSVSTYVVVSDLSGNVQGLLNTDGAVVASYHYGPFGEGFSEVVSPALANGDPNPFGFGGGWTDPVSGLVYFHNRWYSPSQGRFISEDPSGVGGGVNLFTYTNNDPINYNDPDGTAAVPSPAEAEAKRRAMDALFQQPLPFAMVAVGSGSRAPLGPPAPVSLKPGPSISPPPAKAAIPADRPGIGLRDPVTQYIAQRMDYDQYMIFKENLRKYGWLTTSDGFHFEQLEREYRMLMQGVRYDMLGYGTLHRIADGFFSPVNDGLGNINDWAIISFGLIPAQGTAKLAIGLENVPLNAVIRGQRTIVGPTGPGTSTGLLAGRRYEEERLDELGVTKNTTVWRPTKQMMDSAAFKVIVGVPKFTSGGEPKGVIVDTTDAGGLEIKGGRSTLASRYQLRLLVYRSLMEQQGLKIESTRIPNPTLRDWLTRWGVQVVEPDNK